MFVDDFMVALTNASWVLLGMMIGVVILAFIIASLYKRLRRGDPLTLKKSTYSCFLQDGQIMLLIEGALKNSSDLPLLVLGVTVEDRKQKEYPTQPYSSTARWVARGKSAKKSKRPVAIDTTSLPLALGSKESVHILQALPLGTEIPGDLHLPFASNPDALTSDSEIPPQSMLAMEWTATLIVDTSAGSLYLYPTMTLQYTTKGYYQMKNSTFLTPGTPGS